jgi:amino acid adenylation domain-containing protein
MPLQVAAVLALSPEQQATLNRDPAARCFLAEAGTGLEIPRFAAALNAALRAHEIFAYQSARLEGYRVLRLQRMSAPLQVSVGETSLAGKNEFERENALSAWLERLQSEGVGGNGMLRVEAARAADGRCWIALLANPLYLDLGSAHTLLRETLDIQQGKTPPPVAFQYPQYIEWRRALELESGEEASAGKAYWDSSLEKNPAHLPPPLSSRFARAAAGKARQQVTRRVDTCQAGQLAALAQAHGANREALLQALWWALLARLTGFDPFVAGWRHDCRADYAVMTGAVGVFEKTLPVFIDARADERLTDWLARFSDMTQEHLAQQEYWPLAAPPITAHLAVGFGALPVDETSKTGGAQWWVRELPGALPDFELALHVQGRGNELELTIEADAHYALSSIERLSQQMGVLLAAALAHPDARLGDIDLVGDEERAFLLGQNPAQRDFGRETLLRHIARWAELAPEATALEGENGRVRYGELMAKARQQARWLRAYGVTRGSVVALMLPRSAALVSAILAVWQAGGCYLPLEPEWPEMRRLAVLADAKPALVVHETLPADAQTWPWRDVALEKLSLPVFPATEDDTGDAGAAAMEDAAYVLYTSGTTGRSKGVVIEHAQVLNYVAAVSGALRLGDVHRWGVVNTVAADLGNTALFGALFNGAALVIARAEDVSDGEAFSRFITTNRIDALKIVPSHLEALLECEHPALPARIILGGEAAPAALMARIRAIAPNCIIHNHYGPTETTVGVMTHTLEADEALPECLPLSRVLDNNRIYILDENLRLTPTGAKGEVYIGGAQVCRGYLNQEGHADFIADPYQPEQRLYRTHDLAYVLPQGGIRIAGRSDEQLKVQGFRVNPAEVETLLLTRPGVRQAVVFPQGEANASLAACLIGDPTIDLPGIKAWLQTLLPAHMTPSRLEVVEVFPRLANGKVDRQALQRLAQQAFNEVKAFPEDALECVIARNMAELLNRQVVRADENFLEIGAHSLMVIKLAARLRKQLDIELIPATVFEHPTAQSLAALLRREVKDLPRLERDARSEKDAPPKDAPNKDALTAAG